MKKQNKKSRSTETSRRRFIAYFSSIGLGTTLVPGILWGRMQETGAQTKYSYSRGQSISPAFEGWWQNDDESFTLFFGYMNTNWEQELDVPVVTWTLDELSDLDDLSCLAPGRSGGGDDVYA